MRLAFRMSRRLGSPHAHVRANLSRAGVSWTFKLGPFSWNTRSRRTRIDGPGPTYLIGDRHPKGEESTP
jgi:hypothetical protein